MAKKDFKSSPVLNFISQESIEEADSQYIQEPTQKQDKPPAGYKTNPEFIETKSKRVQALIQPSVYEAIKAIAQAEGISVNEAINEAIRKYIGR